METTTNTSNYRVEILEGYLGSNLSNSCFGNIEFYPSNKFHLSKLITYRAMLLYCLATSVCKQFAKICDSAQMTIKASYDQILTLRSACHLPAHLALCVNSVLVKLFGYADGYLCICEKG